jgi:iron(II)-dependent oxidoreductase
MSVSQMKAGPLVLDPRIAELLDALAETRERTMALVSGLDSDVLESVQSPLLSPLVWDLAHIAAFEDLWISRTLGGSPLRPDLMSTYDADETPRSLRGELDLLDSEGAVEYMVAVRSHSETVIPRLGGEDLDIVELVIRHEQQHNETMLQLFQLAHLPSPFAAADRAPAGERADGAPTGERGGVYQGGLDFIDVPGGMVSVGAGPVGFAYDNERPLHRVQVGPFRLARTPATNADWLDFVRAGGYEREELWSETGWAWREREAVSLPMSWSGGGEHWVLGELRPLDPDLPVTHIAWFEAEAFANFHSARLPTELEWETAATIDPDSGVKRSYPWGELPISRSLANIDQRSGGPEPAGARQGAGAHGLRALIGDVWEWTASPFLGYPGFVAYPYREYSEQFFGGPYRVLRGGSWATRPRVISATFRNWDLPERRQIFSGVRLARDAR